MMLGLPRGCAVAGVLLAVASLAALGPAAAQEAEIGGASVQQPASQASPASTPLIAARVPTTDPGSKTPVSNINAQRQARANDRDADRARAQALQQEVEKLRAQLVRLGGAEASGERAVGGAKGRLETLNLEEAELKIRMGHNQESLTKLLGALQMFQRNPPPPLLVDPRSARDAARAAILIKAIAPELERRSRAFVAASEQLTAIRRRAAVANGDLFQAESDVADRQAKIQDLIDQKRGLELQLRSDAQAADNDVRRLATRARSLGELVTVLDAHDLTVRSSAGQTLAAAFVPPAPGPVIRRFGEAGADSLRSKGWTWAADPGAVVVSPAAARVDYAGPLKDWGLVLILRVGEDHLVLAGLSRLDVDIGMSVAAGEPVGRAGDRAGKSEVYLEVRHGSTLVNPARWFGTASQP
jgi:septal ring factor EnvC (AmiA/AmiB activator)